MVFARANRVPKKSQKKIFFLVDTLKKICSIVDMTSRKQFSKGNEMSNATETLFTATVYDFYGEEIDSFTGNSVAELERRVWTLWSGSEQATTYTISDSLGAELVCEALD
jgi:hypothetical protein